MLEVMTTRAPIPRAAAWQVTKYFYFWWFAPLAGILYPPGWIDIYRIMYAIEVTLGVVGAVVVWKTVWREGLLFLLYVMALVSASQTILYVEGRHRLILEPAIAAFAGCGIVVLLASIRRTFAGRAARDVWGRPNAEV